MLLPRPTIGTSPPFALVWLLAAHVALAGAMLAPRAAAAQPSNGAADAPAPPAHHRDASTTGEYSEDEIKAAFLFHFATYAQWPGDDPDGEVTFAVLRAPSVADALEHFAQNRLIQGRPVRIRQIRSLSQLHADEVLYIGASENRRLAQLIEAVDGPTLVVTDAQDGLPEGAMINFQLVDRRVRFEVGLSATQRAGLSLSSRLLSAAMRVEMSGCDVECSLDGGQAPVYALRSWRFRTSNRA